MTGLAVKERLLLFCSDNGMIASRDPAWLQEALTVLVALFRRAGLEINVNKTKVMMCHPGFIKTHFSNARCKRRITGEGPSPQQHKKTAVNCPKRNKKMNKASLLAHMERIHGEPCVVPPELPEAFLASHQPRTHVINWSRVHKKWKHPVEGCPHKASTNANSMTTSCTGIPVIPSMSLMTPCVLGTSVSCVASSILHLPGGAALSQLHVSEVRLPSGVETQPTKSFGLRSRSSPLMPHPQRVWALSGTWEEWNLALILIGRPCAPTSGGPAANGANFPSFSLEKVPTPVSLACSTQGCGADCVTFWL